MLDLDGKGLGGMGRAVSGGPYAVIVMGGTADTAGIGTLAAAPVTTPGFGAGVGEDSGVGLGPRTDELPAGGFVVPTSGVADPSEDRELDWLTVGKLAIADGETAGWLLPAAEVLLKRLVAVIELSAVPVLCCTLGRS